MAWLPCKALLCRARTKTAWKMIAISSVHLTVITIQYGLAAVQNVITWHGVFQRGLTAVQSAVVASCPRKFHDLEFVLSKKRMVSAWFENVSTKHVVSSSCIFTHSCTRFLMNLFFAVYELGFFFVVSNNNNNDTAYIVLFSLFLVPLSVDFAF